MYRLVTSWAIVVALQAGVAAAELQAEPFSLSGGWLDRAAAVREDLAQRGLHFSLSYTADFFHNVHGGLNTSDANQYRGLLLVEFEVETEPLGLWPGGLFYASMIENHGRDISERHVGDIQALNNADAPNFTRLYEFWFEQSIADGLFRLKVGKIDSNVDFAAPEFGAEFVQSSSGFSPTIPLATWPDPALGVVATLEPADGLFLKAGVFDALSSGTQAGFETAFHSPDHSLFLMELGLPSPLALLDTSLSGSYRIGWFYHSANWDVFFNDLRGRLPSRSHRGNAGLYVVVDQWLMREAEDPEQGIGLFLQFAWAPSRVNEITQHYGGGVQWTGPFDGRDDDVCGLAVHHVSLSGRVQSLEDRFSETAIEMFYKVQLTDQLSLKPDIQYIVNPGGHGRDALVVGLRFEIAL